MRSYARVFGCVAWCLSVLSGCSSTDDYQVAVTWLINGTTPNQAMCDEHGIARARFEVIAAGGKRAKTIEGDCASLITLSNGFQYGGFYTNSSFEWDQRYDYSLTLVDAAGTPVSVTGQDSFALAWGDADIYQLNYLDYVAPVGRAATLSADWIFQGGSLESVAADCSRQGVSKIRIFATSALDDPEKRFDAVQVAEADCGAGKFASNGATLATGNYLFFYQAIGTTGNVVTTTKNQELFVDFNQQVVLQRANFFGN